MAWYPVNNGKLWTVGEMKVLRSMLKNGSDYPSMCDVLGRSITAVYMRAKLLRFSDFAYSKLPDDMTLVSYGNPVPKPEELK